MATSQKHRIFCYVYVSFIYTSTWEFHHNNLGNINMFTILLYQIYKHMAFLRNQYQVIAVPVQRYKPKSLQVYQVTL